MAVFDLACKAGGGLQDMILLRFLANDLSRRKASMLVVFVFIFFSALLAAGGAGMLSGLAGSLRFFFSRAQVPHFVQMHGGEISAGTAEDIASWVRENSLLENYQISEMISIDGSSLRFSRADGSEAGSIMDISLVVQNRVFDYLLDMENRIPEPGPGEIGVPVLYAREKGVCIGDTVTLSYSGFKRVFRVAALVRDAQMNPAVVHSKRFLMNRKDYRELKQVFPAREHLISFRLGDPSRVDEFSEAWQATELPQGGPAVDYRIFFLLNSISDGIAAIVLMILSLLLLVIAVLCLRFTILGSIEEDYREIGIMKALGMPRGMIRRIFLFKYLFITGLASASGSLASLPFKALLMQNIQLSIGHNPSAVSRYMVPVIAAAVIFLLTLLLLLPVFRRFNRISAVDALRSGSSAEAGITGRLPLISCGGIDINIILGLRDIVQRPRLFALPFFVYFFSALIILIPVHFLTTLKGPEFISYMGIGRSDIRIDLRYSRDTEARFKAMKQMLNEDPDVTRHVVLQRSLFTLLQGNKHGDAENSSIVVETGDHSLFPLNYLEGGAPETGEEIAISYLYSRDLEKQIGDSLVLEDDGITRRMRICGIYQDITNGGRTAKALTDGSRNRLLGYTAALDLADGIDPEAKVGEYGRMYPSARVTHLQSYLDQTLGGTIAQLSRITRLSIGMGLIIAVLITALFLRMLAARDAGRIAVMRSIGFSCAAVRLQYLSSALFLLVTGIAAGSLFANTPGQAFVGFLWSFMGAPGISFVIDPLKAYLILPLALLAAVTAAVVFSIAGSLKQTISVINVE